MGNKIYKCIYYRRRAFALTLIALVISIFGVLRYGNPQWNKYIYLFQVFVYPKKIEQIQNYSGIWRTWYPNGVKKSEEIVQNGYGHGTIKEWHIDGSIKSINYSKRVFSSNNYPISITWYPGYRIKSIHYKINDSESKGIAWYPTGVISEETTSLKNEKDLFGKTIHEITYYDTGLKRYSCKATIEGHWDYSFWNKEGTIVCKGGFTLTNNLFFKNNYISSRQPADFNETFPYDVFFGSDKYVELKKQYTNDISIWYKIAPDGKWTYWYDNKQKKEEGVFNEGKEDGEWIVWDKGGKEIARGIYRNGKEWDGTFVINSKRHGFRLIRKFVIPIQVVQFIEGNKLWQVNNNKNETSNK